MACGVQSLRCCPRNAPLSAQCRQLEGGLATGNGLWTGLLTVPGTASSEGLGSSNRAKRSRYRGGLQTWRTSCEHNTADLHSRSKAGSGETQSWGARCRAQPEGQSAEPHTQRRSRRRALVSLGLATTLVSGAAAVEDAAAFPGPEDRREAEPQVFFKTPSGTKVQELLEGKGPAAKDGDTVTFHYVCRRSNGYYVYSTVEGEDTPASLPLGQGKVIRGLEEVLAGMRPGGKRRALIPPAAGYIDQSLEPVPPGFGPQRSLYSHAKEPLVFEVQLLKIK